MYLHLLRLNELYFTMLKMKLVALARDTATASEIMVFDTSGGTSLTAFLH